MVALALAVGGCGQGGQGGDGGDGNNGAGGAAGVATAETTPASAPARAAPVEAAGSAAAALAGAAADGGGMSAEAQALVEDYALGAAPCVEVEVPGAIAAISCDLTPITYDLARMADDEAVAAAFAAEVEADRATPHPWYYASDPGTVMGQAYSQAGGRGADVHWTNEQELVVGHASQPGGDSLAALEEWWGSDGSVVDDGTGSGPP